MEDALISAQKLVRRVANTGPLASLLKAGELRYQLQTTATDLMNSLDILAHGEQLLVSACKELLAVLVLILRC
jgi:hypothetical protein